MLRSWGRDTDYARLVDDPLAIRVRALVEPRSTLMPPAAGSVGAVMVLGWGDR